MNRHERRQQGHRGPVKPQVIIAGDNMVATEIPGHAYEARPRANLGPKVAGQHRWVTMATWAVSEPVVRTARDADTLKFLDNENLLMMSMGCWDCEQPLGAIEVGSICPAGDEWSRS